MRGGRCIKIIRLIQQPAMGYEDLSHAEVITSKLSVISETESWDKSYIP